MTEADINQTYTIHDRNHEMAQFCMSKNNTNEKGNYDTNIQRSNIYINVFTNNNFTNINNGHHIIK